MQTGCKRLLIFAALLASFGLTVLALWPGLDLAFSVLFLVEPHRFATSPLLAGLRRAAAWLPYGILFIALMLSLKGTRNATIAWRPALFLVLSFALGPGLLVNGVLKSQMHRPRPVHIQAFGGSAAFQPVFRRQGDCPRNCSFPSGEAAAAFWTIAPALLAPLPLQMPCVVAALLFGLMTGLLRIGAGGHFLSDVLFSGLAMIALISGLFIWLRPRAASGPNRKSDLSASGLHEKRASL